MEKNQMYITLLQQPMHQELLLTKLELPAWHEGFVSRPRLMSELCRIIQPGITFVSAPAGYGKTMAIAEWVHKTKIPAAWFTLDRADNDPQLFWTYLMTSVSKTIPGLEGKFTHLMRGNSQQNPENLLDAFLNELGNGSNPIAIVLDDIHTIKAQLVRGILIDMIDKLPQSNIRLILLGRKDPVDWVRSVKVNGKMSHVRVELLRFEREEIREFLVLNHLESNHQLLNLLESKTEGWIMGMVLAVRYAQKYQPQGLVNVFRGGNQLLFTYLADEVFLKWDKETQDFLLKTSILDRMTVPICNEMTGRRDSGEILTKLSEDHSLVICLNQSKGWYRYQKLLTYFLRYRLFTTKKDQVKVLYKKAGDFYAANKILHEAIHYYLKGRWYQKAADLIDEAAPDMLNESKQVSTLRKWIIQLPERILLDNPQLFLVQGCISLLEQDNKSVEPIIKKVECILDAQGKNSTSSKDVMTENSLVAFKMIVAIYSGRFQKALGHMEELDHNITDSYVITSVVKLLARRETEPSLLRSWLGLGGNLKLIEDNPRWSLLSMKWFNQESYGGFEVLQAEIHYEKNELDQAAPLLMQGLQKSSENQAWGIYVPGINLLSKILIATGNVREAKINASHAMEQLKKDSQRLRAQHIESLVALIDIRIGNIDGANGWMQHKGLALCEPVSMNNLFEKLVRCRILLQQKRAEQASLELVQLMEFVKRENRLVNLVEIQILKSICNYLMNDSSAAMHCFEEAMDIGYQQGYLRIFIDDGDLLLPIMKQYKRKIKQKHQYDRWEMAYLDNLIKKTTIHCRQLLKDELNKQGTGNHALVESLTERELQVLRCLSHEMTQKEVAQQLGVSVSTVKVHTRNIYGKLQVCNKSQAVAAAKDLKLI